MEKSARYLVWLNISSLLRNLYGIIRAKSTAVFLHIFGVGILGQIATFNGAHNRLIAFGVDTYLINRLSKIKRSADLDAYYDTINFSFLFLIIINITFLALLLPFSNTLTILIFDNIIYKPILQALIFLGPIYAFSYIFEIITQANSDFKRLVIGRNISNLAGILSIIPFIYYFGYLGIVGSIYLFTISGGIYFIIINKNIVHNISVRFLVKYKLYFKSFIKIGFTDMSRKIFVFSSLLIFRVLIVKYTGMENNGLFQAIWSISLFPDIILSAFVSFYFPTISGATTKEEIRNLMKPNFEYLIYMIFPIIVVILMFSDFFLVVLYNKDFTIVSYELKILAFFKFFQAVYLFFSITFLGQTRLKAFLLGEIVTYSALLVSARFFIPIWQVQGAVISVLIMNVVSIIIISYFLIKYSDLRLPKSHIILAGKFVILLSFLLIPVQNNILIKIIVIIIFITLSLIWIDMKQYKVIIKSVFPSR